jgi:hypothetical protein
MTMTRTDVHRPSAAEFDPADYDLRGVFDLHPEDGTTADRVRVVHALVSQGIRFGGVHPTGQCDHCGAHIRYEALMLHRPTNTLITIGEQCLDERFELATAADFRALRAEARRKAEITREQRRLHDTAVAVREWLVDKGADAVLVELAYPGNGGAVDQSEFLSDIARKLWFYGELSDRQVEVAARALRRDTERRARDEQRERAQAARAASGACAPEGKVEVIGLVGPTWQQPSDFSPDGYMEKFRVHADGGYDVVSTVPAALLRADGVHGHADLRGRRVRFTATLKPQADDKTAAWASRPSKATLV